MKEWFSSNCVLREALSKIIQMGKELQMFGLQVELGKSAALAPSKAPHAQLECLGIAGFWWCWHTQQGCRARV